MKEVRITLLVVLAAVSGYVVMVVMSGCRHADALLGNGNYHVTCYSYGTCLVDTEATWMRQGDYQQLAFIEAHTGKKFWITGDCVIAKESP